MGNIVDSGGNSLGFVAITKDITDRRRLQEQLIVSEKLAVVGQLAASFSHDIRNPLGVIKNSISFLELRLKEINDDKVRRHLKILGEEIDYANVMVNDLLDFTRKNPPRLHKANLNDAITNALSPLSISARARSNNERVPKKTTKNHRNNRREAGRIYEKRHSRMRTGRFLEQR